MIRLRPHHLLCALTFVGEGYTDAFVENFRAILARIDAGEPIEIVAGPDDICAPLVATADAHCTLARIAESDALTTRALLEDARLHAILAGGMLDGDRLTKLRDAFAAGSIRAACVDCSWNGLCTTIAGDGYARSVLRGSDVA